MFKISKAKWVLIITLLGALAGFNIPASVSEAVISLIPSASAFEFVHPSYSESVKASSETFIDGSTVGDLRPPYLHSSKRHQACDSCHASPLFSGRTAVFSQS